MAITVAMFLCCGVLPAQAADISGELDLGVAITDATRSWVDAGLGKLQRDDTRAMGQLTLRADPALPADFVAAIVVSGGTEQHHSPDLREAWLGWNPLPKSAWRSRVRAGAFLPVTSLEVGYRSAAWTPERTISHSAVNTWFGEELRTNGVEWTLLRRGALVHSSHDYGATAAVFVANDPAGTLLAWRGWSLGDRLTGQREVIVLPDLPAYRPDGPINRQMRQLKPFHEVDGRPGFYVSALYRYGTRLELDLMHYDNRGEPLRIESGQYSWHTRFDHVGARLQLPGDWLLLTQSIRGSTLMGPTAVALDFGADYLLVSHSLGAGDVTARYDRFYTVDRDHTPNDPNGETGHAWTLAYRLRLNKSLSLLAEVLQVDSVREARSLLGLLPRQVESNQNVRLRWKF